MALQYMIELNLQYLSNLVQLEVPSNRKLRGCAIRMDSSYKAEGRWEDIPKHDCRYRYDTLCRVRKMNLILSMENLKHNSF